jgi:excisionase family DNA binding protein
MWGPITTRRPLLRPSEAAEPGLSTRAIYRAIERGELRAARLRSRLRIPPAAFDEWIEQSAVRPIERQVVYPPVRPAVPGSFPRTVAQREEASQ